MLIALVVAFIFCGVASAATVKTNQISTVKNTNVGVTLLPDLKPTSMKFIDKGFILVNLGVKNQGKKVSPSFTSNFYINGKFMGSAKYSSVKPGKTVIGCINIPYGKIPGTNYKVGNSKYANSKNIVGTVFRFDAENAVDSKNKVEESNEKNNKLEELVPLVDLKPPSCILDIVFCVLDPNKVKVLSYQSNGKIVHFAYKPVHVILTLRNLSKYPIKSASFWVYETDKTKDMGRLLILPYHINLKNPIIYGETRNITLYGTAYMNDLPQKNYNLGFVEATVVATGLDIYNNPMEQAAREGGQLFEKVFEF